MSPEPDRRAVRIEQGALAILLATGFVFSLWWLVAILALVTGAAAVFGPGGSAGQRLFRLWAQRQDLGHQPVADVETLRLGELVEATGLVLATLGFLVGLDVPAFLVALGIALIATVGAAFAGWPIGQSPPR